MDTRDAALEEFKALRAETLSHMTAQTSIVGLALTAIAALGAIAVGFKDGGARPEVLLVLPILLNGLGLAYMGHTDVMRTTGRYIESQLWPYVADPPTGRPAPSWESFIRTTDPPFIKVGFVKIPWLLNAIPGGMIFGVPVVAALAINRDLAATSIASGLGLAWWLSLATSLVCLGITAIAAVRNRHEDEKLKSFRAQRSAGATGPAVP